MKNIVVILSLFLLNNSFVFSKHYVDSLKIELQKETNDTKLIFLLNELSWEYAFLNTDSAIYFATISQNIISKNPEKYINQNSFNIGMLGVIYDIKGDREKALNYYQSSLDLKIELNDSIGIASTYTNIGALFYSQKMYKKALNYFFNALEIEENYKNYDGIEGSYINIAIIYKNLNQLDSAKNYLKKAEKTNEITQNLNQKAYINANLGSLFFEEKNYDLAKKYYENSIQINRQINNSRALSISLENQAKIYLYKKDFNEALVYLKEADSIVKIGGFFDTQLKIFETYHELNLAVNNFEKANLYKDSISIFQDSIFNNNMNQQINDIETKYQVEKTKSQVLEKEAIIIKELAKNKNLYIGIISLIIVFIIILIVLIYVRKSRKTLAKKNKIIEKSLAERELLIREIHHRVKNNIQSIKSLLNIQKRRTEKDEIKNIIENLINRLHSMTFIHENLYQQKEIYNLNLEEYLTDFIHSIIDSFGFDEKSRNIDLKLSNKSLPIDQILTIGLLMNEIISNACKYAKNDEKIKLQIKSNANNNIYSIEIQDFGNGLPENNTKNFGMELIFLMTQKLNGNINFKNNEFGLLIQIEFPYN